MSPVFQHLESFFKLPGLTRRKRKDIYRFIKTGIGIKIVSETHTNVLQKRNNIIFFEMGCSVKRHVLGHMSQPLLVIIFQDGTGIYYQPQFHFLFWLLILADIIG